MFLKYLAWGEITGKAHKLLTSATENDKVGGDSFYYKLPLLLPEVGDGFSLMWMW